MKADNLGHFLGEKVYPCYHLSLLKGLVMLKACQHSSGKDSFNEQHEMDEKCIKREVSFQHTSYVFVLVQTNWVTFSNERKAGWCCL